MIKKQVIKSVSQMVHVAAYPKERHNGVDKKAFLCSEEKVWELAKKIPTPPEDLFEPKISETAHYIGQTRYAKRNEKGEPVETDKEMFWRVAYSIACADLLYEGDIKKMVLQARKFYSIMASQQYIPNTPTMLNAGKAEPQMSACFVLPIDDSIRSIGKTMVDMALIHKSGGGTGFSFSRLRPYSDVISSSGGFSTGPCAFLQAYNDVTSQIKQGGVRRGANMGIMHINHPDVLRFAVMKVDEFNLTNFNISVTVTEKWMEQVEKDKKYVAEEPKWDEIIEEIKLAQQIRDVDLKLKKTEDGVVKLYDLVQAKEEGEGYELINPRNGEVTNRLNAYKVFLLITKLAWQYGDPGMILIDRINASGANPTPHLGQIESTNPCITGDTWIHTSEGPKQVYDLIDRPFLARVDGKHYLTAKDGFYKTGQKQTLSLHTKEGYGLKLTHDHKVQKVKKLTRYALQTEWVEVKNLKLEDKILINNHRLNTEWAGKYSFTEGYLMGLLIGDGTLKKDKAVLSVWQPSTSGSGAVMSEVSYLMQSSFPEIRTVGWMEVTGRNEYRFSKAQIKHLANEMGMYPGEKMITAIMEQSSSDFHKGLLRGLFDSDGSVQGTQSKGVSVRLSQSDLNCLKIAQRMLLRLGIVSCIYQNRRLEGIRELPNGKGGKSEYHTKAQHELVISGDNLLIFQEDIGFKDSLKSARLKKLLKNYKRVLNRERFVATVEKIEHSLIENVYDVQIPGINAFDANGLYVHNCGEQPLLPYDACTLGSINVGKFVRDGKIDFEALGEATEEAIHFLDNVLDMNNYPIPEIKEMTGKIRRVGLGVMGFADLLYKLGIGYNTEEGLKTAEEVMACIQKHAKLGSVKLAKVRGVFPAWHGSIFDPKSPYFKGEELHIRNSAVTTIAPTGTISMLADAASGIEPYFALSYSKNTIEGKRLFNANPLFLEIAKKEGFYSDDLLEKIEANNGSVQSLVEVPETWQKVFVTTKDISPDWHVRMQAAFQKQVDNAISKTINFPFEATVDDVRNAYMMVYETGCKGITIYRDGSRTKQILEVKKEGSYYDQLAHKLEEPKVTLNGRPVILRGRTYKITTPVGEAFITINRDESEQPFEVFLTIGKAGMHIAADAEAIGRLTSLALRVSRPNSKEVARKIVNQLRGIGGASQVGFGKDRVMSLADGVAKILAEDLALNENRKEEQTSELIPLNLEEGKSVVLDMHADLCPSCGQPTFIFEEGCKKCESCGYSVC